MQLFSVAFVAFLALTTVQAEDMASIHLRINSNGGVADWGACTGGLKCSGLGSVCVRYSQYYAQCKPKTLPQGELCGQNDGTNVWKYDKCPSNQKCAAVGTDFRCANKKHHHKGHEDKAGAPVGVVDWGTCTGGLKCSGLGSVCVRYSQYYAQCKPKTLPQGELCGQNDGTNIWSYDHCPNGQTCQAVGTDRRCKNKSRQRKDLEKDASCTITIESQCDGQNWSGSTCCADPNYECRWSDDGQNVKRCQKIAADSLYEDLDSSDSGDYSTSGADDYSDSESFIDDYSESESEDVIEGINGTSYVDSGSDDYTSYVDDWGDCSDIDVGCSNPTSECVVYSDYYAQCKPQTLPSGELCGQDDGTNVWSYDHCPSDETCEANGSDFRCSKA